MPLTMPSSNLLSGQLNKLGLAAKSAGPSLFSPAQAPGPVSPAFTSMGLDRNATTVSTNALAPLQDWSGFGLGSTGMGTTASLFPNNLNFSGNPFAPQAQSPLGSGGSGSVGSFGGAQAQLNNYDAAFASAGAKYGIDPNWLKAIAAIEDHYDNSVDQYGAVGIMGIMPGGYADLEAQYPGWQNDPSQNIALGAAILASKMRENGGTIEGGIQGYLGWGTDAYGTTAGSYLNRVTQYYNQLQQNGGQFAGGTPGGGGIGNLSSMFGNATVPDWGEYGAESNLGYYSYGTQYGMNGTQHTGVDVPMPVGSSYRAPMGGTVTCAGTGRGSGADGGGCSAFGDYYGNGAGRVEVLLDNGTVLIFGHSSTSAFQPGQRFNAGDVLGTSGGMNSPHIHLEARVRDSSTPSGYRIVDPRTIGGGGGGSLYGQPSGSGMTAAQRFMSLLQGFQGR